VLLAGALLLSLTPSAFGQIPLGPPMPADLANIVPYTGLLTPYAYQPPIIPNTWITPNYLFDYEVPRVVYVPVAVPTIPPQPALQPVQVAALTLRRGAASVDVRVTPGTVVMWRNAENQDCTLVVAPSTSSGTGAGAASQSWQIPARGSFSLAFNQPGTYDYITHFVGTRLQDPDHWARITVTR
jgi:hypothetical protein